MMLNDVECYGFFGSSSDPLKGTGGGALMIGHGFTSPTDYPKINLTDTIGGGSGASAHITYDTNGAITQVTVDNQGSNFYFADVETQQPTNGAGARFAPVVSGPITGIDVIPGFGGSKYSVDDTITIIAPNQGSGASAHVSSVDSNGKILYITMDSQGDNYIPGQAVAFVNSTGAGAQLTVRINGKIRAINVVSGGKGYGASDVLTITNNPHNTLYLQQSVSDGSVSPANLDLGNLTVHGSVLSNIVIQKDNPILQLASTSGVPQIWFGDGNLKVYRDSNLLRVQSPTGDGVFIEQALNVGAGLAVTGDFAATGITHLGSTIKIGSSGGINYFESGLTRDSGSSAPLYFTNMNAGTTWAILENGVFRVNSITKLDGSAISLWNGGTVPTQLLLCYLITETGRFGQENTAIQAQLF
jgi:hypothetical protein